MAEFKIVIADPKSRKAYQKEVDQAVSLLLGKKIGDKVSGSSLGLDGYTLELTGGSDKQGFPMRKDVDGQGRKRIILTHPPGFHPARKGQRKRKSVCGNTISDSIMQINLKVATAGKKSIEEAFGVKDEKGDSKKEEKTAEKKEEPKKEEKPAEETKAEEKKEEPKKEEKPAEKKEEEPGQEKAEEKMGIKKLE